MREINPCSFKPNGHEDLTARAKLRAKKSGGGGSNGQKAKWARSVVDAAMPSQPLESSKVSSEDSKPKETIIELLSDDDGEQTDNRIDENKIRSIKVKKEDIPKCWIEVYLLMPKDKFLTEEDKKKNVQSTSTTTKKITSGTTKNKTKQNKTKNNEENLTDKNDSDQNDIEKKVEDDKGGDEVCVVDRSDAPKGRYVQLDLFNGGSKVGSLIDQPKKFESLICNRKPVAYVIAVDATGLMIDVTGRYSCDSGSTKKLRLPCIEWWDKLVHSTRATSLAYRNRENKEKEIRNTSGIEESDKIITSSSSSSSSSSSPVLATVSITIENNSSGGNAKSNGNSLHSHQNTEDKSDSGNVTSFNDVSAALVITSDASDDKKGSAINGRSSLIICNNSANSSTNSSQKSKAEWRLSQQLKAEQEEFDTLALNEPLPSTLSGFKNHPLYTLHRDLKVDVCVCVCVCTYLCV